MAEWRRCGPSRVTQSCAGPGRGYQSCLVLRPPDLGLAAAPHGRRAPIPVARDPSYTPVSADSVPAAVWDPGTGPANRPPAASLCRKKAPLRQQREEALLPLPRLPRSSSSPRSRAALRGAPFAQAGTIRPTTALIRSPTPQTTGLARPGVDWGAHARPGRRIEAVGPVAISGPARRGVLRLGTDPTRRGGRAAAFGRGGQVYWDLVDPMSTAWCGDAAARVNCLGGERSVRPLK